jgi:hypothetical protein
MYITLKQFADKYPWPSLLALRSMYFDATKDKNDFLPAFSKVGKRVLISPDKFFSIVEDHGKTKEDHAR